MRPKQWYMCVQIDSFQIDSSGHCSCSCFYYVIFFCLFISNREERRVLIPQDALSGNKYFVVASSASSPGGFSSWLFLPVIGVDTVVTLQESIQQSFKEGPTDLLLFHYIWKEKIFSCGSALLNLGFLICYNQSEYESQSQSQTIKLEFYCSRSLPQKHRSTDKYKHLIKWYWSNRFVLSLADTASGNHNLCEGPSSLTRIILNEGEFRNTELAPYKKL